jgi:CRISPR-associated protein Csm3
LGVVSLPGRKDNQQGKPLGFSDLALCQEEIREQAKDILRLFGGAPEGNSTSDALVREIGPTRLAFWDCPLDKTWVGDMQNRNLLLTETKTENMIDRIKGVAEHPRNTERVPAGAKFDFSLTLRIHDGESLLPTLWRGLKLLELTGLGGSGSRGYGKVRFARLELEGRDLLPEIEKVRFSPSVGL